MNNASPDNPNPFGHHTVRLRAHFAPDGAAPSITNGTALAGPNQVMIPAALVPEGTSAPAYPYEHIAQARFTPGQDDSSNSTGTSPQRPRATETPGGLQRDTPMPGDNTQRGPRQFAAAFASPPRFGAPAAGVAGSDSESAAPTPRRSVRSTQANFSAAVPQPRLETSPDTIDTAVRALGAHLDSGTSLDLSRAMLNLSQPTSTTSRQWPDTPAGLPPVAAAHDLPSGVDSKQEYTVDVRSLPDKPTYLGADHECVALVRKLTGAPESKKWVTGDRVRGNQTVQPGTAIATFDQVGQYRGHAAIYLGQDARGLIVFDQWAGKGVASIPARSASLNSEVVVARPLTMVTSFVLW